MKKYLLILFISVIVSGCAREEPKVLLRTEYASIPETFKTVPVIPDVPKEEYITVSEALSIASKLRTVACLYASRYRELYRFGSFGNVVLALPTEAQCPTRIK